MDILQKLGTEIFCTTHFVFHKIYVDKHVSIWKSEKYSSLYFVKENRVTDDSWCVVSFEEVK